MADRFPGFLGLGTQKGGTTSLHQLLAAHPQVFLPGCKEVHYFDLNHQKPLRWYTEHFSAARPEQICGDITPFYLFHPDVPDRIKARLPDVKLIVLLRDPVERALSQVFHAQRKGFEPLDLVNALKAEPERLAGGSPFSFQKHSYISRSRYLEQLDRYEQLFSPEQLCVLKSEDLFEASPHIWPTLIKYLKLPTAEAPTQIPKANAGSDEASKVDPRITNQLRELLLTTARGVRERYGFGWTWDGCN